MSNVIAFTIALSKRWWALMSCAAFTFLSLWIALGNKGNRWTATAIGVLAIVFLLMAAYGAWNGERRARLDLAAQNKHLEERYLEERPRLALHVESAESHWGWRHRAEQRESPAIFHLRHLAGRAATNIYFEDIRSMKGSFSLKLEPLPSLTKGESVSLRYEVWEGTAKPDLDLIVSIGWGEMLLLFVKDRPKGQKSQDVFQVVANFEDQNVHRRQVFEVCFDPAEFKLVTRVPGPKGDLIAQTKTCQSPWQ